MDGSGRSLPAEPKMDSSEPHSACLCHGDPSLPQQQTVTKSIAPVPRDARWDPTTLPDDEEDEEPRWTELQIASHNGDLPCVQEILSRHDDPAERDRVANAPAVGWYGQTALQAACSQEHIEVVQALLDAGADIAAPGGNNIYCNAFEVACGTGNLYLVRLLLDAGATTHVNPKEVTRYQGRTPLQAAAEGGNKDIVTLLLDLGADINAPASPAGGVTALQAACSQGHVDLARLLLAKGADVNAPAGRASGFTALQAACLKGHAQIVELLLRHKSIDVNAPGAVVVGGGTALHAAASGGHLGLVKMLLAAGARANGVAGRHGQTAVQCAHLMGRDDIVDVLVEAGAVGRLTGGKKMLFGSNRLRAWSDADMKIDSGPGASQAGRGRGQGWRPNRYDYMD